MKVLRVTLEALSASFRNPNSMNYQDSLPFPPPTTITGVIGAALGKEYMKAQEYCRELFYGVIVGDNCGMAKDQWAIRKIKGGGREIGKAVVTREVIYKPSFKIIVCGPEDKLIEIEKALQNPVYPLSLGRDDEFITSIGYEMVDAQPIKGGIVSDTVLKGDLTGKIHNYDIHSGEIKAFKTYWLSSSFERDSKNPGLRRPSNRAPFTFVNARVDYTGELLSVNGLNFPIWR